MSAQKTEADELRDELRHTWAFMSMAVHILACEPHRNLSVEKFREKAHDLARTQPDAEKLIQSTNEAVDPYLEAHHDD